MSKERQVCDSCKFNRFFVLFTIRNKEPVDTQKLDYKGVEALLEKKDGSQANQFVDIVVVGSVLKRMCRATKSMVISSLYFTNI
jgi:hypothetical protein